MARWPTARRCTASLPVCGWGDGSLTPSFEQCLLGLREGESKSFTLAPEEAFGLSNPDNIYHLDRAKFGNEVEPKVGTIILFDQPNGSELPGIIRAVEGMSVTVDFNHPGRSHRHLRGGDPGS